MNGAAIISKQPGPQPAPLNAASLKAALTHPQGNFARVEVVASAGSTNTDLAAHAADSTARWPDLSVLIADAQPAGKGRLGRSWEVPAGAAMISSVYLHPAAQLRHNGTGNPAAFLPTGYGWLSILAGIAACERLRTLTGVPAELKWPNDVVANGRKLAGILAQVVPASGTREGPGVVVGAGINVSLRADELPTPRATSLLVEGGTVLDRNVLLPAYLNKFAALYREFVAVGGDAQRPLAGGLSLLELAGSHMGTLGAEVRAELPGGAMLQGTATGLGVDGALLLRDAGGTVHAVSAGDVVHLRRTGPDGTVTYA
ncbi:biotin--[acetyl-CoA-carboxylase] ligase [Arthrobacter sp. LAPM80]|uniref:biotin--[acetyl-CoA-carboxylase] ligase n=1 Tax=Arthrobacter sp. LAPM80 TaxID=3141788 RepID=UPI00398B2C15